MKVDVKSFRRQYKYTNDSVYRCGPVHGEMVSHSTFSLKIGCKAELHSLYKSLKEGRRGQGLILVLNEVV